MIATPSAPQIFVAGNHRADLFLIRCDATDTIKTLSQTPYNDGTIVRDKAIHPYTLALYLFTLNNIQIINSVFFLFQNAAVGVKIDACRTVDGVPKSTILTG